MSSVLNSASGFTPPSVLSLIGPLDVLVMAVVFLATLYAIYLSAREARKQENMLEWLLMGRRLTLPLFVMSLVASWYGGIFGVTEITFKSGIYNFVTQGLFWYASYLIFAFFIVGRLSARRFLTYPDMIEYFYGKPAAKIAAVFSIFNMLPVTYVISIGLFLQMITGMSFLTAMFLGVGFVCAYNMLGGMRADVYTDAVQFVVMCTAVLCLPIVAFSQFGGLEFLRANLPEQHFTWHGGHGILETFAWGLIALGTLVDPLFYQRCFASENVSLARRGILWSTLIWCLFDLCTTAGGLYARALLPDAPPGQAYFYFGVQILPDGLRGLFIAGIVCTIISTLDSFLFIASQTFSVDLFPKRWGKNIWGLRFMMIIVGLMSIALALSFSGSIRAVWKTLGSYWTACLVAPTLYALSAKTRPLKGEIFLFGSLFGAAAVTLWRWAPLSETWALIDDLYIGILACIVGMLLASCSFFHFRRRS